MKFKDEHLNELYRFMEMMDGSDDYILLQVSVLNPGKKGMEMSVTVTGKTGGKESVKETEATALLVTAMLRNDTVKRLITAAATGCRRYEELMRRTRS